MKEGGKKGEKERGRKEAKKRKVDRIQEGREGAGKQKDKGGNSLWPAYFSVI